MEDIATMKRKIAAILSALALLGALAACGTKDNASSGNAYASSGSAYASYGNASGGNAYAYASSGNA